MNHRSDFRDIVISTRVRLARNLQDTWFPSRFTDEQSAALLDRLSKPLLDLGADHFRLIRLNGDNRMEARALVEQHLISPELASNQHPRGVVLSRDNRVSVMIGEEDHVRIQALGPGLCLDECLTNALRIDDILDQAVEFAFDETLGYLTSCPTNLGTGLRASVMLHLPLLTESGSMRDIVLAAGKMGLAVRGLYGEGTDAFGMLYQVSNQTTLGLTEEEIISRVCDIAQRIISNEYELREQYKSQQPIAFEDRVWRAWGLLNHARRLSSEEGMHLISDLRLGVSMGAYHVPVDRLDEMLTGIQPGVLILAHGQPLRSVERDTARAAYVRQAIGGSQASDTQKEDRET